MALAAFAPGPMVYPSRNGPRSGCFQATNLQRQVPLLYGLLLIARWPWPSLQAPIALTVSVPAVLFTVSVVRMIHWFRASRNGDHPCRR
jgi:predicted signal transduction protein with EAL and GGDEF domain